jgi:SOS-response transcriptional repressor LexA
MMGLTERQKAALDFIAHRLATTAIAPTVAEIARHMGGSKGNAHAVITALVERGHLRRLPRRAQALEVVRYQYFRFDNDTKQLTEWQPPYMPRPAQNRETG